MMWESRGTTQQTLGRGHEKKGWQQSY